MYLKKMNYKIIAFLLFISWQSFAQEKNPEQLEVQMWDVPNYVGDRYLINVGHCLADCRYTKGLANDKISSVIVPKGYKLTIYEEGVGEGGYTVDIVGESC